MTKLIGIHGTAKDMVSYTASPPGNTPSIDDVKVRGKSIPEKYLDRLLMADVEMTTDQASEITLTFDDPAFEILSSGLLTMKTPVTYRGLRLYVAVIETNEGGGLGGLTVRCRPMAIRKLKDLRGSYTAKQITPARFLIGECKRAGITEPPVAQTSGKRKKIARDIAENNATYDPAEYPSAWTTMQRLAEEEGFLFYEVGGTIFFGQPTWLVSHQPKVEVMWYADNGLEPFQIPQIRQSEDSKDLEIDLTLPLKRAGGVMPGTGIKLNGFPKYSGTYFINSVAYPLAGDGDMTLSVSTIRNPEKAGGSTVLGYSGEWVEDADKRGVNCKYTPREMVNRAHNWIGKYAYAGHCMAWVDVIGKGRTGGSANPVAEWPFMLQKTQHGDEVDAPAGACVFWDSGVGDRNGHIAISVGGGQMITTTSGAIKKCAIRDGYINGTSHYVGWKYPNLA